MKITFKCFALVAAMVFAKGICFAQQLKINDLDYFEKSGVNIFVYNNQYNGIFNDENTAGIELIHHGVRTATGGAVRLENTPEQWDRVPVMSNKKVDRANNTITLTSRYQQFDFEYGITVAQKGEGVL